MNKRRQRRPAKPCETPFKVTPDRSAPWCLAAMVALFVAAPLIPSESAAIQGTGVVLVMLWLVLLLSWALSRLHSGKLNISFGATDIAFAVLLMLHSISGLVMARFGHARPTINMVWQWISFGVAFFLARQLVRTSTERL